MTEAQATVIAAALTIMAAVIGVWLGARLFGGRVKSLEEAVQHTEIILTAHKDQVEVTLKELRQTLTTTVEGIGQLRGAVSDIPTAATVAQNEGGDWAGWERMRDDWSEIRDELERIAADPTIDGRTRAKYGRIDRRQYWRLIEALDGDRLLGALGQGFAEANTLWQRYKSGRRIPDQAATREMEELRKRLVRTAHTEAAA